MSALLWASGSDDCADPGALETRISRTEVKALLTSMRRSCGEELRGVNIPQANRSSYLFDDSLMLWNPEYPAQSDYAVGQEPCNLFFKRRIGLIP